MAKSLPGEETDRSTNADSKKTPGERQLERYKREGAARGRHAIQFWKRHDKESYRCPDCGRGAGAVDSFDVHHKDGNPLNGDPDNLVALCKRCHNNRHGKDYDPPSLNKWRTRFLGLGDGED